MYKEHERKSGIRGRRGRRQQRCFDRCAVKALCPKNFGGRKPDAFAAALQMRNLPDVSRGVAQVDLGQMPEILADECDGTVLRDIESRDRKREYNLLRFSAHGS